MRRSVLGGFWQVCVIFVLHWGIVSVGLLNFITQGFNPILAVTFTASFAQTAVVMAIFLETKDKKLKSLFIPTIVSGIFGSTESVIYGITFLRIKTFVIGCIGTSIGSALLGLFDVKDYVMGGLGIFGFFNFINLNGDTSKILNSIIAVVISMTVSFVLTLILYKENNIENFINEKIF